MELANITLNLGGDALQQIQKFNVTPAEVAVLRLIHGNDAVNDLQIVGEVDRSSGTERQRLVQVYGRGIDGRIRAPAVEELFPGVAARLYERFDEMEDSEEIEDFNPLNEVVKRVEPKKSRKKAVVVDEAPEDAGSALE